MNIQKQNQIPLQVTESELRTPPNGSSTIGLKISDPSILDYDSIHGQELSGQITAEPTYGIKRDKIITESNVQNPHSRSTFSLGALRHHIRNRKAEPNELLAEQNDQIKKRNDWLDEKLNNNPERPLPLVKLQERTINQFIVEIDGKEAIRTGDPKVPTSHYHITTSDGEKLGFLVIKKPHVEVGRKAQYYIGDIQINDDKRNHGYGPATYLEIFKSLPDGVGFRTEGILSPDARRVWASLESKGVAHHLHPGKPPAEYETVF